MTIRGTAVNSQRFEGTFRLRLRYSVSTGTLLQNGITRNNFILNINPARLPISYLRIY